MTCVVCVGGFLPGCWVAGLVFGVWDLGGSGLVFWYSVLDLVVWFDFRCLGVVCISCCVVDFGY